MAEQINISSRLKKIREETKLSQDKFSKKYNIPLDTYSQWERGVRKCPIYVLELLEFRVKYDLKNTDQNEEH